MRDKKEGRPAPDATPHHGVPYSTGIPLERSGKNPVVTLLEASPEWLDWQRKQLPSRLRRQARDGAEMSRLCGPREGEQHEDNTQVDIDMYRVSGLCLDFPQRTAAGRALAAREAERLPSQRRTVDDPACSSGAS